MNSKTVVKSCWTANTVLKTISHAALLGRPVFEVYFANQTVNYYLDAYKLKTKVIDTTGAGDAFNGAFAFALANEYKYKDALIFANKVAGISTTKLGAAKSMPTIEEVNTY